MKVTFELNDYVEQHTVDHDRTVMELGNACNVLAHDFMERYSRWMEEHEHEARKQLAISDDTRREVQRALYGSTDGVRRS